MSRGTALITGASSGIGEALARVFAREGFDLLLTARRLDRLEALQKELTELTTVHVFSADLTSESGVSSLCETVDQQGFQVDILVNNAGMMPTTPFVDTTPAVILETMNLNMLALTRLCHHYLPGMLQRRSGRILNVASVAAFHPVPGMDLYAATKAYVLSLSESLSANLQGTGVSVTALCPGLTRTDMVDESLSQTLPPFMMSTAEEVAREGFSALMAREPVRVPGGPNRLALTWAQHQPRWLIRNLGGLAARFTGSR